MTRHAIQSDPTTSAASWDLRHPGCIIRGANGEEIHEFMGMWPLKPNADLVGQKFQRAVAGDGKLEDKVEAFFAELSKPYPFVPSGADIDADVANEPQFSDVPERLGVKKVG